MSNGLDNARKQYDEMGFDTLPLIGGSKKPYARAWHNRLSFRLWQSASTDANIGIRGGGLADVAFIDCDDSRAFETVTNWLAGLGYRGDSYPVVQTASGEGRHIYITLAGRLSGDARDLSKEIGTGEFRYGAGAYVVAPPSRISDGGGYSLISGDFSSRPRLEVSDILPILGNKEIAEDRKPTIPRRARAMLHGESNKCFQSRSHFDESLIASLINAGHSFESVLKLFEKYETSGKYHELKQKKSNTAALHYLSRSYSEAQKWTQAHESKARQSAEAAIDWAKSRAWKGRTGAVDQLVFMAHAEIAHRAGRLTYAASCRELAERAGVGKTTATRATWRLRNSGLIVVERSAVADCANVFQLAGPNIVGHSPRTPSVRKCPTTSNHDVFRHNGLGKSAGQVWEVLQHHAARIGDLVEITGRHVKTIERALERMKKMVHPLTGEDLPMVESDDGKTFHALPVDLDRIADAIGTAGAAERQRREHARDRRLHARGLALGKREAQ